MVKILLLAANPKDTSLLQLNEEIREIDREVRRAKFSGNFQFEPKLAVRLRDIAQLLEEVKPDIVHFSGHGNRASEIILEDESGNSHPVAKEVIKEIFALRTGKIRCVVLNACYTEAQATAIADDVDCVVGMLSGLNDQAAISFSREFYRQLANGESVLTAFKLGRIQLSDGHDLARLLTFKANPSQIQFVSKQKKQKYIAFGIVALLVACVLVLWQLSDGLFYWGTKLLSMQGALGSSETPGSNLAASETSLQTEVAEAVSATLTAFPSSGSPFTSPVSSFSDNFNEKANAKWVTDNKNWVTLNDFYTLAGIGSEWSDGTSLVGDLDWTSYKLRVKINLHNSFESNIAYVIVNAQNFDNFLALSFLDDYYHSNREQSVWWVVTDGEWKQVDMTMVSRVYPLDGYFEVQINNRPNEIVTLINGQKIGEWPNPPYTKGLAGVKLRTKNEKSPASFDDFSIWTLEQ